MIVKVCGVRHPEVVEAAVAAGADWIGIVLDPRSPRHATDSEAQAVVAAARTRAQLVAVLVDADLPRCEEVVGRYRIDALQLHGVADPRLAIEAPVPVIPGLNAEAAAILASSLWWPDCLVLLDASVADDDTLPGGTGRCVDLRLAAALARHRPIILAGGLDAGNVGAAIAAVGPAGVDASSRLESTPGVKDPAAVHAYVRAARHAAGPAASPGEAA